MRSALRLREDDLASSFPPSFAVHLVGGRVTPDASDAFLVLGRVRFGLGDRLEATKTEVVRSGSQCSVNRNSMVEHEALAAPPGGIGGRGLEVSKNAALQVVHLLEAFAQ